VATVGLVGLPYGAMAADIAEPLPPEADWTGFHIGVGGGFGAALHDGFLFVEGDAATTDEDNSEPFSNFLEFDDLGDEGWLGTVEAGFDFQVGTNFVIGVFGDYTFTNFDSNGLDEQCRTSGDVDCIGKDISIELNDVWTVGGRIGFLSSPDTLWYALGGYSRGKVETSADAFACDDSPLEAGSFDQCDGFRFHNDDEWADGFTVGAGVESMWTENISFRLEYRYTDLGSIGSFFESEEGNTLELEGEFVDIEIDEYETDADTRMHSIRAVLSWRFNWL
jgi:outer membrane immunogenic protein